MTERNFDAEAAKWDENPVRVKLARDIGLAIRNSTRLEKSMKALDFGCGTGLLSLAISPYVLTLNAVDSSKGMLEELDKKLKASGVANVRTSLINTETPDLGGPYDLIVSSMTLHHVKDIHALFRIFHGALNTGGCIALADLDEEGGRFHSDNTGVHHFGFNRGKLCQIAKDAGFREVEILTATEVLKPEGVFPVFVLKAQK